MTNLRSKASTSEKILDAADHLFVERGYAGVSARDIAEQAGVNKALVFYHHQNKETLFARVVERYYSEHVGAMEAQPEDATASERLHAVLDSYLDFLEENHRYLRLVLGEVLSGGESRVPIEQGFGTLFGQFMRAFEGFDSPEDKALAPEQFFASIAGLVTFYFVYSPVIGQLFPGDPMSAPALETRREHVHWVLDGWIERLGVMG